MPDEVNFCASCGAERGRLQANVEPRSATPSDLTTKQSGVLAAFTITASGATVFTISVLTLCLGVVLSLTGIGAILGIPLIFCAVLGILTGAGVTAIVPLAWLGAKAKRTLMVSPQVQQNVQALRNQTNRRTLPTRVKIFIGSFIAVTVFGFIIGVLVLTHTDGQQMRSAAQRTEPDKIVNQSPRFDHPWQLPLQPSDIGDRAELDSGAHNTPISIDSTLRGRVAFIVTRGTSVRVSDSGVLSKEVEILEGPYLRKTGWVPSGWLKPPSACSIPPADHRLGWLSRPVEITDKDERKRLFVVEGGTKVEVMDTAPGVAADGATLREIKVLAGPQKCVSGWVIDAFINRDLKAGH